MAKGKFNWYLRRLSKMSLKEMSWRLNLVVNQPNLTRQKPLKKEALQRALEAKQEFAATPEEAARVAAAAEAALQRRLLLFGQETVLPEGFSWLKDPLSGMPSPRKDFVNLSWRSLSDSVSVMCIWWLNRHQHLVPLAQAYALTGDEKYAAALRWQLDSWFGEAAYPYGVCWCNAMEPAMRLLAWTVIFPLLQSRGYFDRDPEFAQRFLAEVRRHVEHVKFNRSRFSSANNHLLAELSSLVCARAVFPVLFEKDRHDYDAMLAEAAQEQFSKSGVNKEQALGYHAFALELLCAAGCRSEKLRAALAPLYLGACRFLINALAVMPLCGETGDCDQAVATGLLVRDGDYYRNVARLAFNLAAERKGQEQDRPQAAPLADPVQWYVGAPLQEPPAHERWADYAADGGVFWNGQTGEGLPVNFFFKTGPLGLGRLAAHGHADALSFLLAVDGQPVFIDPGTGHYHQKPGWREYFRSTRAHNTLEAEGQSQSVSYGPFMWDVNFETINGEMFLNTAGFDLVSRHKGYHSRFTLTHKRSISFLNAENAIQLKDEVLECDNVKVGQFFQVAPGLEVVSTGKKDVRITGPTFVVDMTCYGASSIEIVKGGPQQTAGFYSPVIGKVEPCTTVISRAICLGQDSMAVAINIRRR